MSNPEVMTLESQEAAGAAFEAGRPGYAGEQALETWSTIGTSGATPFALTGRRGRDDAATMNRPARPLVATRFRAAIDRPTPGTYDPSRQLWLDESGRPIIAVGPVDQMATAVKQEPPDPSGPPMWLFETTTKVMSENPDDALAMTETETRVITEDPDDAVAMTETEACPRHGSPDTRLLRRVRPPADDSVTGIVAF